MRTMRLSTWFLLIGTLVVLLSTGVGAAPATDYWPLADGNRWAFAGSGVEMTFVVVELGSDEFRLDTSMNEFVIQREYYHVVDGNIVATRREQAAGTFVLDPPQLFLKSPFVPGQSWTWEGEIAGEYVSATSLIMEPESVETPVGTFEALPVAITVQAVGETVRTIRWFAEGVGLVREQSGLSVNGQPLMLDIFLVDYELH